MINPDLYPGSIVLIKFLKQLMLKDGDQIARTLGKGCATTPKSGLYNVLDDSAQTLKIMILFFLWFWYEMIDNREIKTEMWILLYITFCKRPI